ncbi:hypothetical protein FDUTEX481_05271 [Tolypothrix sp. PCC 7601]|nr:hypothetical protein FDUTEX481_05271 [Tolypothrix sp. PCC 7601]
MITFLDEDAPNFQPVFVVPLCLGRTRRLPLLHRRNRSLG